MDATLFGSRMLQTSQRVLMLPLNHREYVINRLLEETLLLMRSVHISKKCVSTLSRLSIGKAVVPAIMQKQYESSVGEKSSLVDDYSEQFEEALENQSAMHLVKEPNEASTKSKNIRVQRIDKPRKRDFLMLCMQYANDLLDPSSVFYEVDNWESEWRNTPKENLLQNLSQKLSHVNSTSYPNVYIALKITAVLPIKSCTCERSAPSVRLLKTYVRSTMSQERLNGLATIYTHKDINMNIEEVIEKFARENKRRLNLLNILDTDKNTNAKDESVISEIY